MDNKKLTEEEREKYKKTLEESKKFFHKEMEKSLEYKEQQEKIIENLLREKPADLTLIKIHIGFLGKHICLGEYNRLMLEHKVVEATNYLNDFDFKEIRSELLKKYNLGE